MIVPDFDVFEDCLACFSPGGKGSAGTFSFQRTKEALHWRIVIAVARAKCFCQTKDPLDG